MFKAGKKDVHINSKIRNHFRRILDFENRELLNKYNKSKEEIENSDVVLVKTQAWVDLQLASNPWLEPIDGEISLPFEDIPESTIAAWRIANYSPLRASLYVSKSQHELRDDDEKNATKTRKAFLDNCKLRLPKN